jgi:hypothetical protein
VSDDAAKRVVEEGYDRVALRYAELEGEGTWPRMRWVRRVLFDGRAKLAQGITLSNIRS